jgi:type I restriction enzyme S subunit
VNWDSVPYCRCPEPDKYLLKPNDLVFARTGATTGKSFVIRDCPEAVFASYLIRLRVRDTISVDYLYRYFQSPSYWVQIADEKKGTGQPNLNGSKLAKIKVPIAPLVEQRRIVAELDALQAEVDALERLQAETAAELDALLPAILDRAFKGEL